MSNVYEKMKKICDNIRLRTGGTELLNLDDIAEAILTIGVKKYTNQVPLSIDETGAIFNGTGYQDNARVRSSGAIGPFNDVVCTATGFIPVKAGDIVEFTADDFITSTTGNCINYGYLSNGTFTSIAAYTTQPAYYGKFGTSEWATSYCAKEKSQGIWRMVVPHDEQITHLRMSCYISSENLIVTVNEEIV